MDVLFAAGALGVVLLAAMAAAILSSAGRARPAVTIALATILILGAGEGTWQIWTVDSMSFTLLALILTGPAVRRETSPAWQRRSTGYPQRPPRVLASPPVAAATVPDG